MNISQHCFVPTCQYGIDPSNKYILLVSGTSTVSGVSVPRYSLYPNNDSFDKRYNYFDFSLVNSLLYYSQLAFTYRPIIGFSNNSSPYGVGVYLPYSLFGNNLVTNYTYSTTGQVAGLDSCKTMYISDGVTDAQVRYLFWREPVRQLLGMRRSTLNYVEEEN